MLSQGNNLALCERTLVADWLQEAAELSLAALVEGDEEEDVAEEPLSLGALVLVSLVVDWESSVLLGLEPFFP